MTRPDNYAIISGIIFVIGGALLLIPAFRTQNFLFFYAIPIIIIGLVILTTLKKQDSIEQIRPERNKGGKKQNDSN